MLKSVIADQGLLTGDRATRACGIQDNLDTQLRNMMASTGQAVILRSGAIPNYDRKVSPKTGANLTKTSNQGLFKGYLVHNHRFTRTKKAKDGSKIPIGHHKKDVEKLYQGKQPLTQHQVRMADIIRELGPGGDLKLKAYDKEEGKLYFEYREDRHLPLILTYSNLLISFLRLMTRFAQCTLPEQLGQRLEHRVSTMRIKKTGIHPILSTQEVQPPEDAFDTVLQAPLEVFS